MKSKEFEHFPAEYSAQQQYWQQNIQQFTDLFANESHSFVPFLHPNLAINLPSAQVIYILEKRFGTQKVQQCFNLSDPYPSPMATENNSNWLKTSNSVGVNVRTIGSFWNLVKYTLTLPKHQNSLHILPIWECGVVSSLYGMASWQLNDEFYDADLQKHFPFLDTVEKQLIVCINCLHLLGKTVGLDVVPHTDRYSEIVLANPHYFEWLQRKDYNIVDHRTSLVKKIQKEIVAFVEEQGAASADYYPRNEEKFFENETLPEAVRNTILFGSKNDKYGRNNRRNMLINRLFAKGYEPAPATMGPPYRGLIVDPDNTAKTIDNEGRVWRDYIISQPTAMSRVFGPLTRYMLHQTVNNNEQWQLDFSKPRHEVYHYVAEKYREIVETYNFDYMRGDMSHVQMNPNVDYAIPDEFYDIHKYVKNHIAKQKPFFAYFAESFLEKDNFMAYGSEAEHLQASDCDVALGNMQGYGMQNAEHWTELEKYLKIISKYDFRPSFTIFSGDKDDPRFDESFNQGPALRYFLSIFFKMLPSYSAMGFEIRDIHHKPWPNEYYTKLYVFHLDEGPKATSGPYKWGQNGELFKAITKINLFADRFFALGEIKNIELVSKINEIWSKKQLAWNMTINAQKYHFFANIDMNKSLAFDNNKMKLVFNLSDSKIVGEIGALNVIVYTE